MADRRMRMVKKWMILGALAVSLLLVGTALAQGTPSIDWWVIGGGGGSVTVGSTSLGGTIGQGLVGVDSNTPYELCSGFWCGAGGGPDQYEIFLPVILRQYP
jgi:hypothetical protein